MWEDVPLRCSMEGWGLCIWEGEDVVLEFCSLVEGGISIRSAVCSGGCIRMGMHGNWSRGSTAR